MELANLFKEQKIAGTMHFDRDASGEDTSISKKLLTLQAELGTLVIETGCCDITYLGENLHNHSLLEKYMLCFHLIITIGLEKDYTGITIDPKLPEYDFTQQFLNLFIDINDFVVFSYRDHYITLVEDYLGLGLKLGFTEEEIQKASNFQSKVLT